MQFTTFIAPLTALRLRSLSFIRASGVFEVFLNGNTVLLDPVFRNTGIDTYLQKVKLYKGSNDLLVKIGHETVYAGSTNSRYSNFMLRFLDKSYNPLTNIEALSKVSSYKPDSTVFRILLLHLCLIQSVMSLKNR